MYLVGFPENHDDPTTLPLPEMIRSVVPEAQIYNHNIFRLQEDSNIPTVNRRTAKDGTYSYGAHDKANIHDTRKSYNPRPLEEGIEYAGLLHIRLSTTRDSTVGDQRVFHGNTTTLSEPATCTINHRFFPANWIETQATCLLHRVQKHATRGNSEHINHPIMLAGYGLGGIVVKQVCNRQFLRWKPLAAQLCNTTC